jgi:hypothetical protein
MANYTREKSRYGGVVGTIVAHSTPGLGSVNDPNSVNFRTELPAGYLRCDGSILNARDYIALSQVLGTGGESRFRKDNANIQEPNLETGELGQFQLPDLGSKVIVGGRGTGIYNNLNIDRGIVETNPTTRVGPQIDVSSNFGSRITANYVGNVRIAASGSLDFLGNPRYTIQRSTSDEILNIDYFQGHAHNSSQKYLNYTTNHKVGGTGGKDYGALGANSGSGHEFGFTNNAGGESIHSHNITRPFNYAHNFNYTYGQQDVDMSGVSAYVDVDVSDEEKLDQLVTPFILVEYIIKF